MFGKKKNQKNKRTKDDIAIQDNKTSIKPKQKKKTPFSKMGQYFFQGFSYIVNYFGIFLFVLLRFFKRNLFFGLLCCLIISLLYQYTYVVPTTNASNFNDKIPNKKVAFILIKESRFGANKSSFSSMMEHLKTWDFNEETNQINVRFSSMLPSEQTKVVVIYDRGFDSFERYSDLFFVRSFPYEYYFNKKPLVSVLGVSSEGQVDLVFNGKRIALNPNQSYPEYSASNFQFVITKVTNYGFFDDNQFHLMKQDKGTVQ